MTNVRFTTTEDAFYILAISSPSGGLKVTAPVPLAPGDTVTLLGGSGTPLKWSIDNGVLTVDVSDQELNIVTLPAWAFKISYATS
jgi:alpha-L-fucosidase